ncbi:MAG: PAS domain S-box protein [Chitinophagaceae bacterium]|nr:PAS domain S-box protein [Chitinophagaceae bacterium]
MYLPKDISALELLPFFELTPDLVCIAGKDGYFRRVNQSVITKLEYTEQELFARPISDFIYPEDRTLTQEQRKKLIDGKPLVNFQNRYVSKSGKIIWLNWTSVYFPEREVVFAIATEKRLAELEVEAKYNRVKNLADYFKGNIERDRKYLAVSLHEELAQLLAVLKIDIDWIKAKKDELPAVVAERLDHANTITTLLIKTIQRISFTISPGMLDDLGLTETLKWHCNELSLISSIKCTLSGTCNEALLSKEIQLDIFRVCQEALHNIIYHSNAANAIIIISESELEFSFCITDDGVGFDAAAITIHPGLTVMKERAASINASVTISSKPGNGTEVKLILKK